MAEDQKKQCMQSGMLMELTGNDPVGNRNLFEKGTSPSTEKKMSPSSAEKDASQKAAILKLTGDSVQTTADGKIEYTSYAELVQKVHRSNCEHYGWTYTTLQPGAFGYDNLVHSIHALKIWKIDNIDQDWNDKLSQLAEIVHNAWIMNYTYWRDQKPYETHPELYRKPYKPIGDVRRDACANTKYGDLPADEQEKDLVLAKIIMGLWE